MKVSELKQVLDEYDNKKGYGRIYLTGDSNEITKIREIYESPLLKNLKPDDNIPLTEIHKLGIIAQRFKRTEGATFYAITAVKKAIKSEIRKAEAQRKAINEVINSIELFHKSVKEELKNQEERVNFYNIPANTSKLTKDGIRYEIISSYESGDKLNKLDSGFIWDMKLKNEYPNDIYDEHIKNELQSLSTKIISDYQTYMGQGDEFRSRLQKRLPDEDKVGQEFLKKDRKNKKLELLERKTVAKEEKAAAKEKKVAILAQQFVSAKINEVSEILVAAIEELNQLSAMHPQDNQSVKDEEKRQPALSFQSKMPRYQPILSGLKAINDNLNTANIDDCKKKISDLMLTLENHREITDELSSSLLVKLNLCQDKLESIDKIESTAKKETKRKPD